MEGVLSKLSAMLYNNASYTLKEKRQYLISSLIPHSVEKYLHISASNQVPYGCQHSLESSQYFYAVSFPFLPCIVDANTFTE